MPTRRTILQSAAALSATPLTPRIVFASGAAAATNLSAFYDQRHAAGRVFSLRAAQWDAPVHGTADGDVTEFWQKYLSVTWKSQSLSLAGITERPALFMLEQLGWVHDMRVVFYAEHESSSNDGWVHRIIRSSNSGLDRQLAAAGRGWPAVLADHIVAAPQQVASNDSSPSGAAMASRLDEVEKLHSWIIAPRSLAACFS